MTEGRRRGREPADAVRDSTRLEVLLVGPLDPIPTAQHLFTLFYAVSSPGRHGPQNFRRKAACLSLFTRRSVVWLRVGGGPRGEGTNVMRLYKPRHDILWGSPREMQRLGPILRRRRRKGSR